MDKDLMKVKEEMMKPGWTEDLHHELENLSEAEAIQIVESMNEKEIYKKVNNRAMQEDYIADYLAFLWEISEAAFWRHVIVTLDTRIGLLWADHMPHIDKMCTHKIPDNVFKTVLHFATYCEETIEQDIEAIGCVVRAQVKRFGRKEDLDNYISSLPEGIQKKTSERFKVMLEKECHYRFA